MNFVRFIENRYQELTLQQQSADAFNVRIDSEIKASHDMLTFYRWVVKWAMMPVILCHWIAVALGYKPEPQPVLINKAKAEKTAEVAKKDNVITLK